jgi:hypothetical protein
MPITIGFFHGNGLIIFSLFLMGKIRSAYFLFGISPRIWNGLRTYTEVPLYIIFQCNKNQSPKDGLEPTTGKLCVHNIFQTLDMSNILLSLGLN